MKQFARYMKHKIILMQKKQNSWEEVNFCFASIKNISEEQLKLYDEKDFGVLLSKDYKIIRTRFLKNISRNIRIKIQSNIFEILKIINEGEESRISQFIVSQI
jgi:head-tail adaptor